MNSPVSGTDKLFFTHSQAERQEVPEYAFGSRQGKTGTAPSAG